MHDKTDDNDGLQGQVSCGNCHANIPRSEAFQPEAEDYTLFFCGLECYAAWRRKAAGQGFDERMPDHDHHD